jgi:hypothetical protein
LGFKEWLDKDEMKVYIVDYILLKIETKEQRSKKSEAQKCCRFWSGNLFNIKNNVGWNEVVPTDKKHQVRILLIYLIQLRKLYKQFYFP